MIRRYKETDFITSLRALAATLVIILHTSALLDYGFIGNSINRMGGGGVYMFFVIAGFSVAQAYLSASSFQEYLTRRFFRIAPAYYLVITVAFIMIIWGIIAAPVALSLYDSTNLVLHYLFISFVNESTANSILGVEWTLPIEFFWYILLVPALARPRSWAWLLLFLGAVLLLAGLTKELSYYLASQKLRYPPTLYGAYFVLGIIAHKFRSAPPPELTKFRPHLLYAGLTVMVGTIFLKIGNAENMAATFTFLMICGYHNPPKIISAIFENKVMLFLGTISYGLYLCHPLVIFALHELHINSLGLTGFFTVYPLTILMATALFLLVERPSNRLGWRLATRLKPVRAEW